MIAMHSLFGVDAFAGFKRKRKMIEVTKYDGTKTLINQDLIEMVESTPDTVITLTTGRKIITKESRQEIDNLVKSYRKGIYADLPIFDKLK